MRTVSFAVCVSVLTGCSCGSPSQTDGGSGGGSATGGGIGSAGGMGGGGGGAAGGGSGGATGGGSGGGATGGGSAGGAATAPVFTDLDGGAFVSELGQAFSTTFTASGTAPIIFGVTAGALPAGMALVPTSGLYSGTPTAMGTFTFSLSATNSAGSVAAMVTHLVQPPPPDAHVLMTNNRLATITTRLPSSLSTPVALTGLNIGDTLVAIDRRQQTGMLYALGVTVAGGLQLYAVHPASASVTPVGTASGLVGSGGGPIIFGNPATTTFDIDFNPQIDRLRVVDSAGHNLRMTPFNGSYIDGDLGGVVPVTGINPDGPINGTTTTTSGVAYTNNQPNVTVTTVYTLDFATTSLCIQNPPNSGTQTLCQATVPGINAVLGFDIASGVNATAFNAPVTGLGLALVRQVGQTAESIATVNLATGGLSLAALPVTGARSVALMRTVPLPMAALTSTGMLLRFNELAPGTTVAVTLTFVTPGETLVGIDIRPTTGQLLLLGVNATTDTATLYLVDAQTGGILPIGVPGSIALVNAAGSPIDFTATGWGINVSPSIDRVRVVNTSGLNFRINPATGAAIDGDILAPGTNPDLALNTGATGASANGVAFTNGAGEAITVQYVLSATTDTLYVASTPNIGGLSMPVAVTLGGAALDFTAAGFDIPWSTRVATLNTAPSGPAYAALTVGGISGLYRIDLTTGVATSLGTIGAGSTPIVGLAIGE